MAGEGRADGDVDGFRVADLTDEDDVGVLSQDRPQAGGEGEASLGIDGDLVDALELVLDRILDGDDLVLGALDLRQTGVEGRRLTRAGGTGDQDHAVGLGDHAIDEAAVGLAHPEADEVERERALVEQSHHHALAVERRHRGDADVDLAALEAQGDVAVLGNVALGDVHVRHDLHATDEGGLKMLGRLRLGDQHAIDAVLDPQIALERLDVHVGGPRLDRLEQQQVHQIDERRLLGHPVDVFRIDGVEVVLDLRSREPALVGEALRHAGGGGAVGEPHHVCERRLLGADASDGATGHGRELVDRGEVGRVGHRDRKPAAIESERHGSQPNRDIGVEQRHCVLGDLRWLLEPGDSERITPGAERRGSVAGGDAVGMNGF